MTAPSMPIVGDITLTAVQEIDHVLDGGFVAASVPGLDGDPLQRAGRGSHAIRIRGVLRGETTGDDLATLQASAAAGEELPFAADITTALELQQVVISDFRARAVAGLDSVVTYELWLVESPPLPPPAEVSGFGGLDDFGLGDLGFDTDIMGDLSDLADQAAGAVDAVMDAADQLQALAALGSIDVGGPLEPLGEAVGGVTEVASTFASISASLAGLLGGGGE
jgi:hypothetical protein